MAYMSQERKAQLVPGIKAVLNKYKLKGTIGVRHHSTLMVNISSGPLDFIGNMLDVAATKPCDRYETRDRAVPKSLCVNPHWIEENYTGTVCNCLVELKAAMMGPDWYDRSDIQTDYFDTSWYIDINIGLWNKPYQLTA